MTHDQRIETAPQPQEELLRTQNLFAAYHPPTADLKNIHWSVHAGELWGILGPNGAGKTTLLKSLVGILPFPEQVQGKIVVMGKLLARYARKELAKQIAYVPQLGAPVEGFMVKETVTLGQLPHLPPLATLSTKDRQTAGPVMEAMQQTDVLHLRDRHLTTLSGGEFQRVLIARALAQTTPLLFLDEPVAHLDPPAQHELFRLLQGLLTQSNLYFPLQAMVVTCHDLALAARYCTHLLFMQAGEIVAAGPTDTVFTEENLFKTYGTRLTIHRDANRTPLAVTP